MRKMKQLNLEDKHSLEVLLQEAYIDACKLENETQKTVNRLKRSPKLETIDDYAKQAKEITAALKLKESAVKLKLEVAKIQHEVIKRGSETTNTSSIGTTNTPNNVGQADFTDFDEIRNIVNAQNKSGK